MLLGSTEEWDGGWGEEIRARFFDDLTYSTGVDLYYMKKHAQENM